MEEVREGEIAVPGQFGLSVSRNPKQVLAEAQEAAKALKAVIESMPEDKKVMMGGEQYIEFDAWQLVARFYGCSVKIISTEPVQVGDAFGFLARAIVLDRDSREISAAEAMCLNDEEKWSARPKYEWHYVKKSGGMSLEDPGKDEIIWEKINGKSRPQKVRVRAGDVKVPMNQLRSMAQTRAGAKAFRNVFSWVVVLAGYAPTPAEELTGDEQEPVREKAPEAAKPKPASGKQAGEEVTDLVKKVSGRDVKTRNGVKKLYSVETAGGRTAETWDEASATELEQVAGTSTQVTFGIDKTAYGDRIVSFKVHPQAAEA